MDTYLSRKAYGDKSWIAKTGEVFDLNGRKAQLLVSTSKNDRGELVTSATIGFVNDFGGVTTAIFSDYFEWLERKATRCTEKAVSEQQARNVANWAQLKDDVFAFYAAKAAV
jgi:hypothetical protein